MRQEQAWFLSQLTTEPALHHHAVAVRLHGPLDAAVLGRAVAAVVAGHELLGSTFSFQDGEVVIDGVKEAAALPESAEDLRDFAAADRGARLARITERELHRPFDLAAGPPIRFNLVRLGRFDHELLIVVHRIAADRRSADLIATAIMTAYHDLAEGRSPKTTEPGRTFADCEEDFRTRYHGGELADSAEFWKRTVTDLPDAPALPNQRSRPEAGTRVTGRADFGVRSSIAAGLRELAAAEDTSVTTVVAAAFAVLLHRQLRTPELVLGVPVDSREAGAEQAIGPFTEALVLRLRLPHDPTWREAVQAVRDGIREVEAHGEIPFRVLAGFARPDWHPSMHPLFQILVTGEPAAPPPRTVAGVTYDLRTVDPGRSPYDVELRVSESDVLSGALTFQEDLFDGQDMAGLAEQLVRLLRQAAAEPDRHLSNCALLGEDERERVLYGWNRTEVDFPRHSAVHELFEEWADRTPDAPALHWEGTTYTYAELDRRANQLAHYLRGLGATEETRIGLHFGYAAEWVVSALAALKAGAAYVPLDPSYPPDRLAMMCETAGVEILLTHAGAGESPETAGMRHVLVDEEQAIDAEPDTRPGIGAGPHQLAYVMFTSGSTGRPKGIAVTHRNIVRTVRGITYTRFAPGDSVAQGSNISFDATTLETWGALLNGARLVGLRKADLLEPQRLERQLVEHRIDMMFLPAALMKQLVAEAPHTFASLRYFQSGGEQADFHTHQRIIAHGPPENLINPYGPTETTVNATAYRTNGLTDAERHVPIGFPLANTTCYILDQYWQPVPAGVVGELFVGGDGVSRGYLGQPGLTAEKFVPDPYGEVPGARLYRTGDLARYRADGAIEFLGRADRQVKIRGFRVEPGEVEAAVLRSGQVREVSVQVGVDAGGDQVLVAYFVPAVPGADPAALREFTREQVPTYMVPGVFVPLPALPLNANGKLDTGALREFLPSAVPAELVEPRTATEGRLDVLLTTALQVPAISVHDNFFRLGGDSAKAVALVLRARTVFGMDLPLSSFFGNPTVAGFAAEIDRLRTGGVVVPEPEPVPVPVPVEPVRRPSPPPVRVESGGSTSARLVEIWREVLDLPDLGPEDDFFANGGHSLKVTRVASRVKAEFGVNVPLRLLFANPTVIAFARAVDELLQPGSGARGLDALLDEVERLPR
ncbi:non-ribosomal peptide synthetase [Amycolatopsis sp. 195334CR]|uniref:non-ribosomal peptide synthetase n=1 Tax=Amycolatopsis sp. 195334CR TaxID=2814588 RepID=UPI001A8CEBD4|nr:non-ribosomal peptide synthetase [Amycolatopsis sp. 195334CR]MBN6038823.1 amino acid adenylation domain-containing protein [Amycolatopsis sp. 195334CR]